MIAQLTFLMLSLVVNGEPLRAVLLKRLKPFSNMGLLQTLVLDVYLGGLILYAISMMPFSLFNSTAIFYLTTLNLLLSIAIHFKTLMQIKGFSKIKFLLTRNKGALFENALVLMMFAVLLVVNLSSTYGLIFGSVRDESIHSLMAKVIVENGCVPVTLQPYLQEGIIYPQASHVIFAFASYVLNIETPKSVFYVSILFKALSVFGAYFLSERLGLNRAYRLSLSFTFAFVSSWPLYIVWGGNPFLVGFPLFLINLGLLLYLFSARTGGGLAEFVAIGLLFGYVGAIMISYLQTLIVTALLLLAYRLIRGRNARPSVTKLAITFLISLIPLSPFLFRFFAFYWHPGHNVGLPQDFPGWPKQQLHIAQAVQWAYENLSPYVLLRGLIVLIFVSFIALLWKTKGYEDIKLPATLALAIFTAAALLAAVSFLLPPSLTVISWGHQGVILVVSVNILIAAFYVKLMNLFRKFKFERIFKTSLRRFHLTRFLTIMFFLLVTAPFVCCRLLADPMTLKDMYGMYAIVTQEDYELMVWMREALPLNAVILVNQYEAGLFIPVISCHKVVFPYSGSSLSRSYQTLINMLSNGTLNETAYRLMHDLSVSHIFVGSRATYQWVKDFKWNHKLFLGNPNFKLMKSFGDAYLFELNYVDPSIAFVDDFEHGLWWRNGWQTYAAGDGVGNVTVAPDLGYGGSSALELTAKASSTTAKGYAIGVRREIFVPYDSYVTLSLYFNVKGFETSGGGALMVLVSDVNNSRSVTVTLNGIYRGHGVISSGFVGLKSFDLSALWWQTFNSSLPNPFVLEIVNYSFDSAGNVVYVDDVKVISAPFAQLVSRK